MSLIDELKAEVSRCTLCPELVETRTQTVFGDGSIKAKVMFVGEAPGGDEDKQGIPFVGRAGQLLNKMLAKVGIPREMVYIANTIKCRPPENRNPNPDEIANCAHFLAAQIAIIKPKVICPLGKFGLEQMVGTEHKISEVHGKTLRRRDGTVFVPLWHPAYVLRKPETLAEPYEKDFRRLKKLLEKEGVTF